MTLWAGAWGLRRIRKQFKNMDSNSDDEEEDEEEGEEGDDEDGTHNEVEPSIVLEGVEIGAKRKRGSSEADQDKVHDLMYTEVEKLQQKVNRQNDVLQRVRTSITTLDTDDVVQSKPGVSCTTTAIVVYETGVPDAPKPDVVSDAVAPCTIKSVPRAFTLAPTHKHAFLNNVILNVESWVNDRTFVEAGKVLNATNDIDFPHRIRWERSGPPMRWVETTPRKTQLVVSMRYKNTKGSLMDNEYIILRHANALLPPDCAKLKELKFICYLVTADADNGHDPRFRPKTSMKNSIFKNPASCLSYYNGEYTSSFFHHGEGTVPVTKYNGTMYQGRVIFKDICFSEQCLTSKTVNVNDGVWRLCVKASHPGLTNLVNFSVLSPPFSTGRRVRAIKVKSTKEKVV